MWWFLSKGRNQDGTVAGLADAGPRARSEDQLLARVPELDGLAEHTVFIKVWLPEVVAQTLKWVADYEGVTQSSWVRERLLGYLYGQAALLAHRIRADRRSEAVQFARRPVDRSSGRWVYKVPQLGKNAIAFKVWISERMRDDLDILAKHAGVSLSEFVREALIGDLFGRGSLPERPEILGKTTAAATAWERDDDVPVDAVEVDAFHGLGEAEMVWVLEGDKADRTS